MPLTGGQLFGKQPCEAVWRPVLRRQHIRQPELPDSVDLLQALVLFRFPAVAQALLEQRDDAFPAMTTDGDDEGETEFFVVADRKSVV